jgi:uncharacterized FlgJ-related protein
LFFLSTLLGGLSACGQGSVVNARLDPGENSNAHVTVSSKDLNDRVAILVAALEANLPTRLSDRAAKLAFFKKIAPAVVETMLEIEAERAIIARYSDALKSGAVPTELANQMADLFDRYKTKNVADLLERVDVAPADMLFTQASIESQWGLSAVARDCHNIFGVHAATAAQKCSGHPILAYYPDFTGSIKRYQLLLNTGGAFKRFRQLRAALRNSVGPYGALDSSGLVEGLLPYSERGEAYVHDVAAGISQAHLDAVYREFISKIF